MPLNKPPASVIDGPDGDDKMTWFLALYGATMMSIQNLEFAVSFLFAILTVNKGLSPGADARRQAMVAFNRSWKAFQTGSAGMKLNDRKLGLRQHIPADLYEDLDDFLKGPRNRLVHNYLIERLALIQDHGLPALAGAGAELIPISQRAERLAGRLNERAQELLPDFEDVSEPPPEIAEWIETMSRIALLKQVPVEMHEKLEDTESEV